MYGLISPGTSWLYLIWRWQDKQGAFKKQHKKLIVRLLKWGVLENSVAAVDRHSFWGSCVYALTFPVVLNLFCIWCKEDISFNLCPKIGHATPFWSETGKRQIFLWPPMVVTISGKGQSPRYCSNAFRSMMSKLWNGSTWKCRICEQLWTNVTRWMSLLSSSLQVF